MCYYKYWMHSVDKNRNGLTARNIATKSTIDGRWWFEWIQASKMHRQQGNRRHLSAIPTLWHWQQSQSHRKWFEPIRQHSVKCSQRSKHEVCHGLLGLELAMQFCQCQWPRLARMQWQHCPSFWRALFRKELVKWTWTEQQAYLR